MVPDYTLYSTKVNLTKNTISKIYNKDEENQYTLYSYYALEAKLICGDMTFSFDTEFVENKIYTDEFCNTYRKFDKSDFELKAAYRLLKKIEETVKDKTGEIEITNFSFITS